MALSDANLETALGIMKTRLNRTQGDTSLDETALRPRLRGAEAALRKNGIILEDTPDDTLLLVDYAVWRYQNRDKADDMPKWLRLLRRERFLSQKREAGA